mgnify:CR=1 FL=1
MKRISSPTATAPPPMEATVIPTIWFFVRIGSGELVSDAAGTEETVLDAELLGLGRLVAVANELDEADVVVLITVEDDRPETDDVLGAGATKTMLGIEVCKMRVAVIVAWVFGNALGCPVHMAYAPFTTESMSKSAFENSSLPQKQLPFAELPWQNPILISDIIHCTAPSPIVYPEVLLVEQRQSSVGFVAQVPEGKLASKNERKHSRAHVGMKLVSSGVRV